MAFSDEFIGELVDKNSIEEIAHNYSNLKKRGRTSVGLCPFHGEKTPSFHVYSETNSFYCFGCGAGGDVITFVMRSESLEYVDAVKYLADRAGVRVPEDSYDDTASKLRTRILEANREAARFFHDVLYTHGGKVALDYYRNRGYSDTMIKRFGLGYAPQSFNELRDYMFKKGFKENELIAAFLIAQSRKNKNNYYDIFRHRVMIPIIDVRGNVIGFGGRVFDDSKPKYINTSETLVFKKTKNLFALNLAKTSDKNYLILCEGYMDVIAFHQAGFSNAVAALGTSFTRDHASLVARYTSEVVVFFDPDEAGKKGVDRAIIYLRERGITVRVVNVPEGLDPDDYIKKYGSDRTKLLIERSANDIDYRLIEIGKEFDISTSDGQVAYLREASMFLSKLSSPIEQDIYAGKLSRNLPVSKDAVLAQIEKNVRYSRRNDKRKMLLTADKKNHEVAIIANPDAKVFVRAAKAEEGLIGLLFLHNDFIKHAQKKLQPFEMVTSFNRELYQKLIFRFNQNLPIELSFFTGDYADFEMAYISKIIQSAQLGQQNSEVMDEYIETILGEYKLMAFKSSEDISGETLDRLLKELKEQKK